MPFRILKIKFPKGAWRKPLFYIKTVWIITTIFVSIGFTGMFILYNIDKKR